MSYALLTDIRKAREALRGIHFRANLPSDPVEFAELGGIVPEPKQAEVVRSERAWKMLLWGRRSGKSTTAAVVALHKALTEPNFQVIFTAPSLEQAQIPYLMAISMYRRLDRPVAAVSERRTGLELVNGSELRAMSSVDRSKRGFGCSLLICDEASRIDDPTFYGALLPSITRSAGYVMLMSTPFSNSGFFADYWHAQDDEWERTFMTSEDCEFFKEHPERLEMVKRNVPEWYYRQEYLCEFLADEFSVFNHEDIDRAARAGEDLDTIEFEDDEW